MCVCVRVLASKRFHHLWEVPNRDAKAAMSETVHTFVCEDLPGVACSHVLRILMEPAVDQDMQLVRAEV